MTNTENGFPSFSQEQYELQSKMNQLNNEMTVSILVWAKNMLEGKIISFGHKKDIIKVNEVINVISYNDRFTLKITGKVLKYMFTNNGFDSVIDKRCLQGYTKKRIFIH